MNLVDNDFSGAPSVGDSMEFYKYAEQGNYSDADRATGADGESWVLPITLFSNFLNG